MITNKKMLAGILLAGAAALAPSMASAQVAGMATVDRIEVVMGTKAFKDGFAAVQSQNAAKITRAQQLQTELAAITKPLDSNGDGQLTEADQAFVNALTQRDTVVKSLDTNKDNSLTGTELDQLRARNLPVQQYLEKNQELSGIERAIQVSELYVIDAVNKQYGTALTSLATTKKLNAIFIPGVLAWSPKEMDISTQLIAAIDRALPAVAFPVPEQFSTSQGAVQLQEQIDRIRLSNAVAQARAAQAQQQGAAPGAQPAPGQPQTPPPAGEQPESR